VVRGYNIRADYNFDIEDALAYVGFPVQADLGNLRFRFNAYNLEDFITSAAGDFSDASVSTGSITAARPEWETQLSTIYTRGPLDIGLTWEWNSGQRLFTSGQPSTVENFPFLNFPGYHLFNGTIGYEFLDRYRAQFTVNNIMGTNFFGGPGGELANPTIGLVSTFGRTYRVSLRAAF
jgi:outer membrane receptor protein involved in Fe transport